MVPEDREDSHGAQPFDIGPKPCATHPMDGVVWGILGEKRCLLLQLGAGRVFCFLAAGTQVPDKVGAHGLV